MADAGQLSDEVEQVLMKVLGGTGDELDVADFNVTEYINRHFPDEASLDRADGFVKRWVHEAGKLEEQLFSAVRDQASAGERAARDIKAARDSIDDLKQRTDLIREKSEASETLVREISKDIKELDNAKTNLDKAIATIDKIQMLTTSLTQLKALAEDGTYAGVGRLLEVVAQILTHFSGYVEEVPQVRDLQQQYDGVKSTFRRKVAENFDILTEEAVAELVGLEEEAEAEAGGRSRGGSSSYAGLGAGGSPATKQLPPDGAMAKLRAACEVIDALGGEVLRDRLGEFCRRELRPYVQQFRQEEGQSLEGVDRRYSWFRRKIRDLEARFGEVFPKHWRLSHRLCLQFCEQTRSDLDAILSKFSSPDEAPPELVVRALQKTLEFEKEQGRRYERDLPASMFGEEDDGKGASAGPASGAGAGGPSYGGAAEEDDDEFDPSAPLINDDGAVVDPGTAEGIKLKYRRKREWEERKRRKTEKLSADEAQKEWLQQLGTGEREVGADSKQALAALPGIRRLHRAISDVFDPYTGAYVRLEQRNFRGLVGTAATEKVDSGEDGGDSEDRVVILESAVGLVNQIKTSVNRCVQLGTGEVLFQLYLEAKQTLVKYHDALRRRLPTPSSKAGPLGPVSTATYTVPRPPAEFLGEAAEGGAAGGGGGDILAHDGVGLGRARVVPFAAQAIETLRLLCAIISTAEFLAEACEALGENFQARLDSEFKTSVNTEETEDVFFKLLVDANQAMAGFSASLLDHHVATIRETELWSLEQVQEKTWVGPLGVSMRFLFPLIRRRMSSTYYRQYLDRFAKSFIPRYMAGVYRARRVNEVGAQQMLMDAQTVRQLLLSCPSAKTPEEEEDDVEVPPPPSIYTRYVTKELPRIDLLLKLLAVPQERLASSFKLLWENASEQELAKVMDLKSVDTRTQQKILRELGKDPSKAGTGGNVGMTEGLSRFFGR